MSVTDLRNGIFFEENGDIFRVMSYDHIKMGRGSGNIKVKVKNLKTGSITEKSFITGARVQDAILEKKRVQYLYKDAQNYYFMDTENFNQFGIAEKIIGDDGKFLREGLQIELFLFKDEPISIELPIWLEFKVAETDPGVRGDSVSNIYKSATMENDLKVSVPLFVKVGDYIKVDTRSGEYKERVTK